MYIFKRALISAMYILKELISAWVYIHGEPISFSAMCTEKHWWHVHSYAYSAVDYRHPPTDLIRIPPLLSQSWQVQPLTVWDWRLLWQPWEQALGVAPRWWHSRGVASSRRAQTWWKPCAPPAPSCDPAGTGCSCSPVDTQHVQVKIAHL